MLRRIAAGALAALLSLVLAALALEAAVRGLDLFADERALVAGAAAAGAAAGGEAPAGGGGNAAAPEERAVRNLVHPYRAWSRRPGATMPLVFWSGAIPLAPDFPNGATGELLRRAGRANRYGYYSPVDDYAGVPREHFVVGVFGGSVADEFAVLGAPELERALGAELGEVVRVLNVASAGYKQPQQAAALSEMLALGVPFDLVVNLDGFNEVVFGASDALAGRHPLLPSRRHWALAVEMATSLPSSERLELLGAVARERRRSEALLRTASDGLAARSVLVRAAMGALARRARERAARLEDRLQQLAVSEDVASPLPDLPDPCLDERDGCWDRVVGIWARSSLLMQAAAEAAGARYLHVLQPNQYVAGSKPLSDEEREHAVRPTQQARLVREGYPRLRERGAGLRARGVDFHDLTPVFRDHPETLYRDVCCHMNARGNALLARAVAELAARQATRSR